VSTSADAVQPQPRAGANACIWIYGLGDPKSVLSRQGWHDMAGWWDV